MAGYELGIGAIAAMRNIIISDKGEIALSSNLCAALVQASKRYSYVVKQWDHECCILHFFCEGSFLGESSFTREDAVRANLTKKATYQYYPRNLYFARAMTNGIKVFCPEVGNGLAVYSPEELDLEQLESALTAVPVSSPEDDVKHIDNVATVQPSADTQETVNSAAVEESAIDVQVIENDDVALNTGDPAEDRINQVLRNHAIQSKGAKNGQAYFEQFVLQQPLSERRSLARKIDPTIPDQPAQAAEQSETIDQDPRAQLAVVKAELLRRGASEKWLNEELEKLFDQLVTVETTLDDEQVVIALAELTTLLDQTEPA
jgi:hypothetical protein